MVEIVKKKDFVEIKFSGFANGELFDSNIEEDLKKLNPKAEPKKLIVVVGQGMVVEGLDKALEGKEIGKEYEIEVKAKEGFGERKKELVKTIPLKVFVEKEIYPRAGMVLTMDNMLAKVIAVSGARVITDFNNPLASKNLRYKFKIIRKVEDEKEKATALFEFIFRFVPEFEIKEEIVVKGPKIIEYYVKSFNEKFKELIGKELKFEEKKENKKETDKKEQ
ncbi:MAG: FKBP-type peptidyl-prolyl cis-trans isomerase [Candidatus Pacearchaeota archaeon]|nr:FKBP-type peptidyl-prolyl cis-trans isomerase [Candidatus Pacearchaeota archaeon]